MAEKRDWVSPYNYVSGNPIVRIDPTGMLDGEYEVIVNSDGTETRKKISDIGDEEGIDFLHYTGGEYDGKTVIIDKNGNKAVMSTSAFIKGYTHRGEEVNWEVIYKEWKQGGWSRKKLNLWEKASNE